MALQDEVLSKQSSVVAGELPGDERQKQMFCCKKLGIIPRAIQAII